MSAFVEVELSRAWRGLRPGDRVQLLPNAARLLERLRVAALVPVVVDPPEAGGFAVPARRRGGWPKGKPRGSRRDPS